MGTLGQDLRYALRGLYRNGGFTIVAVLTIGVGIGANTTVFSWMHSLLLDPVPGAAEPDRIAAVESVAPNGDPLTTSFLDYRDFRDHLRSFETLGATAPAAFAVGEDAATQRVWGELVSGNYFDVMRLRPHAGRFFDGAERHDEQNAHAVVVLSYSFWKNRFHGSPSVIGSKLRINRTPFTIVGVAPPAFHGTQTGLNFDLWLPLTMYGQVTHTGTWMLRDRGTRNFFMVGRLKQGVSFEQALTETRALAARMASLNRDDEGIGADVLPVWKGHFTPQAVLLTPVAILMGVGALLLLIVCANLANLLLARATARRREFSIRLAMGAAPRRLGRQLLTETLVLSLAGAGAGLVIATWLTGSLRWLLPRVASPALLQTGLDTGVLVFTTAVAFAVAILAGVGPAVAASRANVSEVLKDGGRGGSGGLRSRGLRGLLAASEVALAVVALVGAGLFLKSFQQARSIHPGFDPQGVALARFDFSTAGYDRQQTDQFCLRLREALERSPGIAAVSYDDSPPLGFTGGNWEPTEVEGYIPGRAENMKINRDLVAPGYFALMKIPILSGRDFDLGDSATRLHDDPIRKVMIVNQEFARRFFRGRDPIGRKVRGWGEWFTVVGVVGNIRYQRLTEPPRPFMYVPIRQVFRPEYGLTFHVRSTGPVADAIASIRREAGALDPALVVFDAMPMTEHISASLYGQKVGAILLNVLGGLALLLAALGLYSVMAYSVAQRTAELGIRIALGANPGRMMLLVLRQALIFALIGIVAGGLAATALARVVASALVSVSPADPAVYAGVAAFTIAIALLSAAVPAWRALRVDPVEALRS
jgi:predicted permease